MLSVQIIVRDMPTSPALESHIRKRVAKLNHFRQRIQSCRVVVDQTQKHKHQGKLYNVRIDLAVPGKELAVTRKIHEDVYVAIRDAFHAVTRQLEEHKRKQQGYVKNHHGSMHGYVSRVMTNEGYGFIEGDDGNEYYFSMTTVAYPAFHQLWIGDAVEFMAVQLSDGLQAHHVLKERRHNHVAA